MIPGISTSAEARLAGILDPRVTDVVESTYAERDYTILEAGDAEARRLGVQVIGGGVTLVVTDPTRCHIPREVNLRETPTSPQPRPCMGVPFVRRVPWDANSRTHPKRPVM